MAKSWRMSMANPEHRRLLWVIALLIAAWIGVWGAWIPHQAVALRVNAIDLAEWSTFLTEVQIGGLRLAPDFLRLAVALAQIAFSLSAGVVENRWLRWALRGVALIPCLLLLPPYPFMLQLWRSESYGLRFVVAVVGVMGVLAAAAADRAPMLRRALTWALAWSAAALGSWAFTSLIGPFGMRYGSALLPGWGAVLFATSLIIAGILEGLSIIRLVRSAAITHPESASGSVLG
jgi:hypothetical protein